MRKLFLLLLCISLMLIGLGCSPNQKIGPHGNGAVSPSPSSKTIVKKSQPPHNDIKQAPSNKVTVMYVSLKDAGSTLAVRTSPSSSGQIAGNLKHRDTVKVIKMSNGWATLSSNGSSRYVKAEYLVSKMPEKITQSSQNPGPALAITELSAPVIKVYKSQRKLELWDKDSLKASYPVGLGWEPVGLKKVEGDGKTPEGSYYVCVRNANSRFYKSLGVSYPNKADAESGYADGSITKKERNAIIKAINSGGCPPWNTPLGGAVMIHGNGSSRDWTAGCVAVENGVMDILWKVCKIGTRIIIYP